MISEATAERFSDRIESLIAESERHDTHYGVYITRNDDGARAMAAELDSALANGESLGPLAGMAIAVKDLIATRDSPTTAQSLVHEKTWFDGADAPVVQRLREAGAVITGKTSLTEHAAGRVDPAKPFPIPRNPWDAARWPGGSSSGSAIAVALGLADAALGTDTTGSLRIPAAFCGITGFRPTTGTVDYAGCMSASPSLDTVGPMARSARECAAVLTVLAPKVGDGNAPTLRDRLDGVRVGVPRAQMATWGERIDPEIGEAFDRSLEGLESLGASLIDIPLDEWDALTQATLMITADELFSRHREWLSTRWPEYGRSFRRLVALAGLMPQDRVAEARAALLPARESLLECFNCVDVIATPTWAQPAPSYYDGVDMEADDLNLTAPWAAAGTPCVATPMGLDSRGLPMSLQLAGRHGEDLRLLEIADCFERNVAPPLPVPPLVLSAPAPIPDPDDGRTPLASEQLAGIREVFVQLGIEPDELDLTVVAGILKQLN